MEITCPMKRKVLRLSKGANGIEAVRIDGLGKLHLM